MRGRFIAMAVGCAWALAVAAGPAKEAVAVSVPARPHVVSGVCPSPTRRPAVGDRRDHLCASVRTAELTRTGRAAGATAVVRGTSIARGVARAAIGASRGSVRLTASAPRPGRDSFAIAGPDGRVTVAYFPAGALSGNFPGTRAYDPALPIGVLVRPAAAVRTAALEPPTPGLVQTGSLCLQVSSNSDNRNTTGAAFYAACYRYYRPAGGDTSRRWSWRQVFETGSGHGGNFSHHLAQTRNHARLDGATLLDDWSPASTVSYSACGYTTVTLGASGSGFSGSVSSGFQVCPDTFGIQFIDATGSGTRGHPTLQWGWDGNKGCGGGTCSYVGNAGGYQAKFPQGGRFEHHESIGIRWKW